MNKIWLRGLPGLALVAGAVACNSADITSANRNPNSPTTAPASALFTSATAASVRRWVGFGGPAIIVQQLANTTYPTSDSYIGLQADATTGNFNSAYTNDLQDFRQVIAKGKAAGQPGVYGPAMVMQTWDFSYLTDEWGDVPYTDALKADSAVVAPKYDAQKAIYTGFFTTLKAAADAMAADPAGDPGLGSADVIYGGNVAKWRRFANSLHARYALRIVNVDPASADAELKAAFSDPAGVFQSNSDNALLKWPGDGVSDNPFADNLKQRDDARLARTMTSLMIPDNDPRLRVYGQPVVDSSVYANGYGGMPQALLQDSANDFLSRRHVVRHLRHVGRAEPAVVPHDLRRGDVHQGGGGRARSWRADGGRGSVGLQRGHHRVAQPVGHYRRDDHRELPGAAERRVPGWRRWAEADRGAEIHRALLG